MEITYVNQKEFTYSRKCSAAAPDSSGDYICKSVVNYLRHGNYILKS
jgi:hypothetical protein